MTKTAKKRGAAAAQPRPKATTEHSLPWRRTRLRKLMERLDKTYGPVNVPSTECALEVAVYLVVREGLSITAASRAMKALRGDFVDWNEVRASRETELAVMMTGSLRGNVLRRHVTRARRLRDLIDQVYNERNETDMEFLREQKARDQIEWLEDLDDLGIHNAYALVQWMKGSADLVMVSPSLAQVAKRVGLCDTAAVGRARKAVSEALGTLSPVAVQAHLTQLGEMEGEWPPSLLELVA